MKTVKSLCSCIPEVLFLAGCGVIAWTLPSWYVPLAVSVLYIGYMNVFLYLLYRDMKKEAPAYRDENHLAGLLHRKIGTVRESQAVAFPILFGKRMRRTRLSKALHKMMTREQKRRYRLQANPMLVSGLTMLMTGGEHIGALRSRKITTHGHILLWFMPALLGIMFLIPPSAVPWDFWTGLGYASPIPLALFVAGYFLLYLGIKAIARDYEPSVVRDLRMKIYVLLVATIDEECVYGWVLQLCGTLAALALGAPPVAAFGIGALVSAAFFVVIHPVTQLWELVLLVLSRVVWNCGIVLFGVPVAVAVHAGVNMLGMYPIWVPLVRRTTALTVRRGR